MSVLSNERRDKLRKELAEGAPGMSEVSLMPDELRALLDGYERRGALLSECREHADENPFNGGVGLVHRIDAELEEHNAG